MPANQQRRSPAAKNPSNRPSRPKRPSGKKPARFDGPKQNRRPSRPVRERGDFADSAREHRDADQAGVRKPRHQRSAEHSERPTRHERPSDHSGRPPRRERPENQGGRPPRDKRGPHQPRKNRSSNSRHNQVEALPERFRGTVVEADAHIDHTFASIGVGKSIAQALAEAGAESPFAIQAATIPAGLSGKDLLVRSHTGSGKTIAFGVTVVESVLRSGSGKRREFARAPKGLIVAPTRELALQIDKVVQPLARAVGLFTTQVYGGVPQGKQVGALRRGVDIVIGTPGRLEDLIKQGHLDLSQVIVSTIDEADHMAELGFIEPVQRLLEQTDPEGQRLLFSATLDRQVASLVDRFLDNPAIFELHDSRDDHTSVDHEVFVVSPKDKAAIVTELASEPGKILVFTRTRRAAEDYRDLIEDAGIRAVDLHGDLNQNRRSRNLAQLTSGRVNVLVATDVAARGIHVDDVDLVVQADQPDDSKTYVHRAGRTGRAGKTGRVITLTSGRGEARVRDLLGQAGIDAAFSQKRARREDVTVTY
jgi:superfamily II DNA/RNA helicase